MVRTFEQIKTDVQNRPVRSFEQIQKDVTTRGLFGSGLPSVLRDGRVQEFLSTDITEEEKYKLANSLYLSDTYKQPFDKVYQNYEGVVAQLFPHTKPKAVFEKIQWASMSEKQKFAAYDKDRSFWQKAEDRLNRVGANTMKQIAGLDEAFSGISLKIQEKLFGRDIFGVTEKLEWSKNMRLAIQEDMKENPGIYINPAGDGFWDTTKNYIANPEHILFGALEQTPLIVASILTSGTAAAAAKGVGLGVKAVKVASFLGGAQGFAIPLFGDRYSDLRTQNIPPEQAFAEAFLASQAEGLLEEWTKIFNIRLFKGPGAVAKRGISDNVAKWLIDKPWYVKAGAFTGSVYAQGVSEEGLQAISDNFWAMMFRNVNTGIFEGVGEQAAAGGLLELAIGGGFKLTGKIFSPGFVSEEEQLARLDVIRDVINEAPIDEKSKVEINDQLDVVEKDIAEGKFTAPPAEKAQAPTKPTVKREPTIVHQGKPLGTVYHGTPTPGFAQFNTGTESVIAHGQMWGPGAYFTSDPELADTYIGDEGAVVEAELDLGKVADFTKRGTLQEIVSAAGIEARVISGAIVRKSQTSVSPLTEAEGITVGFSAKEYSDLADDLDKINTALYRAERLHPQVVKHPELALEEIRNTRPEVFNEILRRLGYDSIHHQGGLKTGGKLHDVWVVFESDKITLAPALEPPTEKAAVVEPEGLDEKLGLPASNEIVNEPDPIKRTERFGIQEVDGKWIVTDWETQKEVSVHGNSQLALKEMIALNKGEIEAKKERRAPLPPSEKVTLTLRQVFEFVMKAQTKAARTAFIQGAKETIKGTKDLGRLANDLLKGLDITQAERKRLITHVTSAKTPNQKAIAIAVIQKLHNDAVKRVAVADLKKTMAFINSKVGKNMYEKGIRPEYYEKIQAIVEGITTKKMTVKTQRRLASLMDYLERVKSEASSQYEVAYIESQIPKSLLEKIPRLGLKNINDMTVEELKEMEDTLRRLIHLNNAKSGIIMGARADDVTQMLDSSLDEVEGLKQRPMDTSDEFSTDPFPENWYSKILSFFAGNRNHDIESLSEAISSGTYGTIYTTLPKGLSRGRRSEAGFLNEWESIQKKHFEKLGITIADLQEFSDSFFQALSPEMRKRLGVKRAKRHSVTIGGKKAPMTMAELMSLYMHAQAVDFNLPAMLKQGVANVHHVSIGKITPAEIGKIADIVESNKKAIGLIRMAQEVLLFSTDKINEVSLLLDGVLTAKEKNYWHVERQTTGGIAGRQMFRISLLESQGRLQEREGSNRPVVIRDFFEAITADEQAIGEYVGLAIPLRSIKNILNYRPLRDTLINKKGYGQELKFIDVLIERLEQKPKAYSQTDTVVKMINRGLVRAVLANPGIMAGQYASTIGYFSEVDVKYKSALRVRADKATQERYKEHSALYKRRVEAGISSVAIHHAMQSDVLLRTFTGKKQFVNYLTSGIHSVDTMAVTEAGRLAEAEMKDKNLSGTSLAYWKAQGINPSTLEFESSEYWGAWEDRFDFLVRRTQPMFFTENRSVLTSAETDLERSLYLFRSYVDQPLRILYRAINDYRNERITKRSLLGQVATVQASLTFYAVMRFAIDQTLFRDDDDEVDLIEEILISPFKILNIVGYPLSIFIQGVLDHKIKGEPLNFRSTDLAPMPIQFAQSVLNAILLLGKGIAVDPKEKFQSGPREGRNKGEAFIVEAILEIIGLALKAHGIPVDTVEDLIKGKAQEQKSKKLKVKFQG